MAHLAHEAFGFLAAAMQNGYLIIICLRLQDDVTRVWALTAQADTPMPDLDVDLQCGRLAARAFGQACGHAPLRSAGRSVPGDPGE